MTTPSTKFDLSGWKLTLPVDASGKFSGDAYEVKSLSGFENSSYFYDDPAGAMVFNAPVQGATTSGSSYPRSELREMNGSELASWNLATGGFMSATLEIDQVPTLENGTAGRVIVGQIHGRDEELVRLYWHNNTLYFQNDRAGPENEEMRFELKDAAGLTPNVSLNEKFSYSINAKGDDLVVKVYADGKEYTSTSKINDVWQDDTFYFKAGMYLGVNETQGTGAGQASFYSLAYNHTGVAPAPEMPPPPAGTPTTGTPTLPGTGEPSPTPTQPDLPVTSKTFTGTSASESIHGTSSNDLIKAGGGDDKIWAKAGQDVIWTGGGKDAVTFDTALNAPDRLMDFDPASDTIRLNNAVFKEIDSGRLSADEFRLGTKARDGNDHIIYDQSSGALWYDPDGSGSKAQILFAWLDNEAALTHQDFFGV